MLNKQQPIRETKKKTRFKRLRTTKRMELGIE